jgi:LuxR family maltose regulon positive regulatory protein
LTADHLLAAEALAWIEAGEPTRARRLLGAAHRRGPASTIVAARVALEAGAIDEATALLDARTPEDGTLGAVEFAVAAATAAAAARHGSTEGARRMTEALADAESNGFVRVLADAGPAAIRVARTLEAEWRTPFLCRALTAPAVPTPRAGLIEPLTDRELEVLRHLPSRRSNAEIAEVLYVSVNTVKTHVKHIYGKLGANDRDDAVRRAQDLRLL